MTLSDCHSIADLRILAQRRLPPVMFDYLDGGAEDELTLHRNRSAFADFEFVPRVLTDVSHVSLGTRFAGVPLALPIVSAPTGMSRMFHHLGERAVHTVAPSSMSAAENTGAVCSSGSSASTSA